jgi:hypothetical protein
MRSICRIDVYMSTLILGKTEYFEHFHLSWEISQLWALFIFHIFDLNPYRYSDRN